MRTHRPRKKPAERIDWHPADIIAGLRKRDLSMRRLSTQSGYASDSLRVALRRPWERAERIIANALQRPPQAIWPSRYHSDGTHKGAAAARAAKHSASAS